MDSEICDVSSAGLDGMFNLSLEIEGLISLLVTRGDMAPEEIYVLLREKTRLLNDGIDRIVASRLGEEVPDVHSVETKDSAAAREKAELERYMASIPAIPGLSEIFDADCDDMPEEPCADIMMSGAIAQEAADEECTCCEDERVKDNEAVGQAEEFELSEDAGLDIPVEPVPPHCEEVAIEAKEPEKEPRKVSRHSETDIRKLFTLNDKFRFRRELFGNSEMEFVDALNTVRAMHSMAEAEDYFYNDLEWNAEIEEVKDFMQVIQQYFGDR